MIYSALTLLQIEGDLCTRLTEVKTQSLKSELTLFTYIVCTRGGGQDNGVNVGCLLCSYGLGRTNIVGPAGYMANAVPVSLAPENYHTQAAAVD